MSSEGNPDPFAWLTSGHFQLAIGCLSALLFGAYFVVGVTRGAVGAMICFGVLAVAGISGVVRGVQQIRARKTA